MARSHRRMMVALLALSVTCLAGCTGGGGSDEPSPEPSASGSASDGASPRDGEALTDRDDVTSGGEAAAYLLADDELPEGWRLASGEQHRGVPAMCNVVLEPPALASADTQRYTRGYSGPFVIQYSFVSDDEAATTKRIDEFVDAAATCTEHVVDAAADRVVEVERITDIPAVGEAFAAVRGTNPEVAVNVQDFVVFRNGPVVTVLQAYSPADLPEHADLAAMAEAIDAKQTS